MERKLLDIEALLGPDATATEIATAFRDATGLPLTGDQASSKLRRLRDAKLLPRWEPEPEVLTDTSDFIGHRTLYVDIEATDLGAAFGHMLCASFCDEWGNVESYRIDHDPWRGANLADDSKLAVAIRDRIERDRAIIVGHNFRLYDRPFINARLVLAGERPIRGDTMYSDTLFLAGGQNLRLGSRRLETIAKYFKLGEQKTPLDGGTWQLAGVGVPEAMDAVVEHCEADVRVERLAYGKLGQFVTQLHR